MNEVEKMYENAGVEADYDYFTFFDDKVHKIGRTMHLCKEELKHWLENYQKDYVAIKVIRVDKVYPPFTAKKQLELIKWLAKTRPIHITFLIDKWVIEGMVRYGKRYDTFEDALSGYINNIWQDLTEEERKQIKNILESEVRE